MRFAYTVVGLQRPGHLVVYTGSPRDPCRGVRKLGADVSDLGVGSVLKLRAKAAVALARDSSSGGAARVNGWGGSGRAPRREEEVVLCRAAGCASVYRSLGRVADGGFAWKC